MTLNTITTIALDKFQRLTVPHSQVSRRIDSQDRLVLTINAPDFPTARSIWKNRVQIESAIARLGLAQYWQICVENCPYTPVERLLSDLCAIEQLRSAIPENTALKTALNFSKLAIHRNHLTVEVEHPSLAFILLSQDCIHPLADQAQKLGLRKLTLLADQATGAWTVVKEASWRDLRS
jgi:hypothetical protein